jgi:hypothetical protein
MYANQVHSLVLTGFTFRVPFLLLSRSNLNLIISLGSKGADGYVTFKFLKDDPQWDDSRYQRLVTFLRNNIRGGQSIVECVVDFLPYEFL